MAFTSKTLEFLVDLSLNNNRPWFDAHRNDYEQLVRQPAFAFIEAMAGPLAEFAPHFRAEAKKVGGSLMRVFRDTRFGNDKSPYKTNIGIQFRHAQGKDIHAPGYYLHLAFDECFLGVGCWHPEADALRAIRQRIAAQPALWSAAISEPRFQQSYQLEGDSLSRPPKGFAADHPAITDIKRKDFIAIAPFSWDEAYSPQMAAIVAERFERATPFVDFLCRALDVPH